MGQEQGTQANTETSLKNKIADFKFVEKPCIYCKMPVQTVVSANPEQVVCEICAKDRAYKKERADLYANKVPPGYRHMKFESFKKTSDNATAFERAQGFRLGNRGLYLVGNPGVGKTHLMFASISDLILNTAQTCKVLFFDEIVDAKIRDINRYEIIESCVKYDILYIDDIASLGKKDETLDILQLLLQLRIRAGKKKIFITSNVRPEDLGDIKVTSRIVGMCDVVEVNGKDMRLKEKCS